MTHRLVILAVAAAIAIQGAAAIAADERPAAAADAPFQTDDISIGEPISLPSAPPLALPPPTRPSAAAAAAGTGTFPPPAAQLPSVVAAGGGDAAFAPATNPAADAALPPRQTGNGWLGLAVDDTVVVGRLVVVEVAPGGPAARAGVRPQDVLLAINGNQLRNGDELAAALAAIGPGQRVKMAIGRDNRVEDVTAEASPRPPQAVSRDWQQSEPQTVPAPAAPVTPPASVVAPSVVAPSVVVPSVASPSAVPPPSVLASAPPVMAPAAAASPVMEPLPAPRSVPSVPMPTGRTALGVRTVPVDAGVQSRFRLTDARGAFVIGVVQDLPAAKAGVPPGSVIVAINRQPVRSPQDLTQLVTRGPVGTPLPIQYVLPGGEARQAEVVLQSLEQPLERALVGESDPAPLAQPPTLVPAPYDARRVQPTSAQETASVQSAGVEPLARLEEMLRRVNNRLDQIERRLERLDAVRR